jgi:hypothetical protein
MQTVNFPPFAVPVIMYFNEHMNDQAEFVVRIEDDEFVIRGQSVEIKNAASGLCHVFNAQINNDAATPNDFFGMIERDERLKYPKGRVELLQKIPYKGKILHNVFVKIGERSINFAFESLDSARAIATGLAEFLGLIKKKKDNEFSGTLKFEVYEEKKASQQPLYA